MRGGMWMWCVCTLVALAVTGSVLMARAAGERRVALVIGNGAYAHATQLRNPVADATLVSRTMRTMGFEVTVVSDADKRSLETALRAFATAADDASVAVIYYAGHGLEVGGVNYVIPIDATLGNERDLAFEALTLDALLTSVAGAKGLRMVLLDACRDNPFLARMRRLATTRNVVTRGLAEVEVSGTLVLYAARAGTTATDGPGANSPFAEAVARRFPQSGVDIRLIAGQIRDDVMAATADAQEPFNYGSLPGQELFLVPGARAASAPASDVELAVWRAALAADTVPAYEDYLRRYPRGLFIAYATARRDSAREKAASAPAASSPAIAARRDLVSLGYEWGAEGHLLAFGNRDPVALDLYTRAGARISPFLVQRIITEGAPREFLDQLRTSLTQGAAKCPMLPLNQQMDYVRSFTPAPDAQRTSCCTRGVEELTRIVQSQPAWSRARYLCGAEHFRTASAEAARTLRGRIGTAGRTKSDDESDQRALATVSAWATGLQ